MNFSKIAKPYATLTDHALWHAGTRDIAKQLPPSSSTLRLLDVSCGAGITLRDLKAIRPDILAIGSDLAWGMVELAKHKVGGVYLQSNAFHLPFADNTFDAILIERTYYFMGERKPAMLAESLRVLREGGRLILVNPVGGRSPLKAASALRWGLMSAVDMFVWRFFVRVIGGYTPESIAREMEAAGFARILAEPIMDGWTILSRGEKPYAAGTATPERVAVGAGRDDETISQTLQGDAIHQADGRFIHVLVRQLPDKPAWKLDPNEVITWGAAAIIGENGQPVALAFTSLPKAVQFMQQAVMAGTIKDVNKIGKFSKEVAADWDFPVILNPTLHDIAAPTTLIGIDPTTAAAPDE